VAETKACRSEIRLPRDVTDSYIPYPCGRSRRKIRATSESEANGVGRAEERYERRKGVGTHIISIIL